MRDRRLKGPVPKLLFVANVDWFFVSHREAIAAAALEAGYEVHLACTFTTHRERLREQGIVLHDLKLDRRGGSIFGMIGTVRRIASLIRRVRPDIVHLVTIKPVLLGGIAARLTRAPRVIAAISGMGFVFISRGTVARLRRRAVALLYRCALGSPRVTAIFQNPSDAALVGKMVRLKPHQTRMFRGSGVDLRRFQVEPLPVGDAVVTFAARLLIDKGVREFVAAAALLRIQGVRARFVVAGDPDPGNPASVTPEELERWAKEGAVAFVGHQDDVPKLFATSHVIVLPSYREGLPKVLIEAAAAGRAVVATDVPGCRDAVTAGQTGLLVPAMAVEPLAAAMKQLIDDRARCAAMGREGRKLAEQAFGIERVVEAHLHLYSDLMGQAR